MMTLNLLVLRCADIERSRAFYESFGMTFTLHSHEGGPKHFAHEDERGVIELYPAKNLDAGDKTGLGFGVSDLARASTQLIAEGFQPGEAADHAWGRTFIVRDPDGRRVEVKEILV